MGLKMREFAGVKESDYNAIFLIHFVGSEMIKYKFAQEVTQINLQQFLRDFEEKKLVPFYKS